MLKPQDVPVVTEILFGTAKTASKFGAEVLSVLLHPETTPSDFALFCATSTKGTWREIANAVGAAVAANPREPFRIPIALNRFFQPEAREIFCPNPNPEFIAGCFLGLFEAGLWMGKWEQESGAQPGFIHILRPIIWQAMRCTNGFLEQADACLDDRYRSELTGAIKKYLGAPLDASGLRFANAEGLLRDIAGLAKKEKRTFPTLINMVLDGLTYGLIGRLSPIGRVLLLGRIAGRPTLDLWELTK